MPGEGYKELRIVAEASLSLEEKQEGSCDWNRMSEGVSGERAKLIPGYCRDWFLSQDASKV